MSSRIAKRFAELKAQNRSGFVAFISAGALTVGPVVLFGQGGTAVEAIADRSIELPPLNMNLARDLIARTRVARLLPGGRGQASVDMNALGLALMRVAQMIVDIPEIVEMDINPLLASADGVLALDADAAATRSIFWCAIAKRVSSTPARRATVKIGARKANSTAMAPRSRRAKRAKQFRNDFRWLFGMSGLLPGAI